MSFDPGAFDPGAFDTATTGPGGTSVLLLGGLCIALMLLLLGSIA